jgi:hypothetical protein
LAFFFLQLAADFSIAETISVSAGRMFFFDVYGQCRTKLSEIADFLQARKSLKWLHRDANQDRMFWLEDCALR